MNLQELFIDYNHITEISGLDNCVNLECIDLRYNKISKVSGFGTLENLETLYISG